MGERRSGPGPTRGDPDPFVDWMHRVTPYVHAHRGRTFVVAFGGEALADPSFRLLLHDFALLHGLGIRLVLIHGARPQIAQRVAQAGAELRYVNGLRITDEAALGCVKEAVGVARIEIEALFSMGLANSPMHGVRIPVASGNFVTARPLGVLDGVDYRYTGAVRRIDRVSLRHRLDEGAIALLSPIGYSPTGEVFNLSAADVARSVAVALEADKLVFLVEEPGVRDSAGRLVSNLLVPQVDDLLHASDLPEGLSQALRAAAEACRRGVRRVHILSRSHGGALLRELFTRDGSGTLVSAEPFEGLRPAAIDDVAAILELLRPLEEGGTLVRRSRERLETEIDRFSVMDRDGAIIACAALYPYPEDGLAELACLAVHPDYRRGGRGDKLLEQLERKARSAGIARLFVLTTQAAHWFRERGFEPAALSDLPMQRQALYNYQRGSQVYIKAL